METVQKTKIPSIHNIRFWGGCCWKSGNAY